MADAEPGLVRLTGLARDLLDVEAAMVSIVDGERELLRAAVGLPDPYRSGASVPLELSLCVRIVQSGEPVLVPDLRRDPVLERHPVIAQLELHSYAGVPLHLGELVVGGFCVFGRRPRQWAERELRLLRDLGGAVATELQLRGTLRQLDEARAAERRLAAEQAALSRLATAVARGQQPEQVVVAAAREAVELLAVDSVVVLRFTTDGPDEVVAVAGAEHPDTGACAGVVTSLRATGTLTAAEDGGVARLAAPVHVGGRLWGALVAEGAGARDVGLAQLGRLSELVGVCVSNAEAHAQLVELARTDPLTGAANRRVFTERLAEELARAQRQRTSTTLVLLDLDRFKALNDTHGHATGDRVLCGLVDRLAGCLRATDLLARLGGDEFAVVLPATDAAAAAVALDRMVHAVGDEPVAGVALTAAFGAVVVDGGRSDADPDRLYRRADAALYRAKARGTGAVALETWP